MCWKRNILIIRRDINNKIISWLFLAKIFDLRETFKFMILNLARNLLLKITVRARIHHIFLIKLINDLLSFSLYYPK